MAKVAILHNNIDRTRNYVLQRENVLGRAVDCSIFFDNKRVSRRHARIAAAPRSERYFIEDISARGIYVNFKRIRGRHPLKEADRICILQFHNVHPLELERMAPEELKACCDDPRNHGIKPVVDLTFGFVDPREAAVKAPVPGQAPAGGEKPKGFLVRLKALLGGDKPRKPKKPKERKPERLEPKKEKPQAEKPKKEKPKKEKPQEEKPTKKGKAPAWDSHRPERQEL